MPHKIHYYYLSLSLSLSLLYIHSPRSNTATIPTHEDKIQHHLKRTQVPKQHISPLWRDSFILSPLAASDRSFKIIDRYIPNAHLS